MGDVDSTFSQSSRTPHRKPNRALWGRPLKLPHPPPNGTPDKEIYERGQDAKSILLCEQILLVLLM